MEMKHDMPVWAPTDEELSQIERQVRKQRAAAAKGFFTAIREWAARKPEMQVAFPARGIKVPTYYQ